MVVSKVAIWGDVPVDVAKATVSGTVQDRSVLGTESRVTTTMVTCSAGRLEPFQSIDHQLYSIKTYGKSLHSRAEAHQAK